MWGGFVMKKNYVMNRENYGHQKMNLIIHVKKNEKSWILKTVYGKHLLIFFIFEKIFLSAKVTRFFVLKEPVCCDSQARYKL